MAGEAQVPAGADTGVVVVHGVCEHRGRYGRAAARLHEQGLATFAFDQRGHGMSPGPRTDIDRFETFADDLATILGGVARAHPRMRVFLWGHSMGAVVAADCAIRHAPDLAGVVTTGFPALAFPAFVRGLTARAGPIAQRLPAIRIRAPFDAAALTHDPDVIAAFDADRLVVRSLTTRLALEMCRAAAACLRRAGAVAAPWLAAHGGEDELAPAAGSEALVEALGSSDKRLAVFPRSRHELHNETSDRADAFYGLFSSWISERSG